MTNSQRIQVRLSESRQALNALAAADELSDEQRSQLTTQLATHNDLESQLQAAIAAEDEHETRQSNDTTDPETRQTVTLLREARVANFMAAAAAGRTVEGTEADLLAALNIENTVGEFPLRLLDRRYDPGADPIETRVDTATDLDGDDEQTAVSVRPWIDRVFVEGGGVSFLGVTRDTVRSGDRRHIVVTAGTTAATTARGDRHDAAAFEIDTIDIEPRRMSCGYLFRREDVARHGGQLEQSLRRDLRMVLSEQHEKGCILGETGQYEGLTPTVFNNRIIETQTNLKVGATTTDPDRAALLAALTAQIDGTYATRPGHVRALISRTVYNRILINLAASTADSMTTLEVARRIGFQIQTSDHLLTASAAGTIVGVVSKARGLVGTMVSPIWESGTMIVDPYSEAAEGQVRLTLTMLFGQPTAVRKANWATLKATA